MKRLQHIAMTLRGFLSLPGNMRSSSLSIIISCLALGVSLFAAVVSYHSAKNVVRPLLYIGVGESQSAIPCFGLFVRNNGMGPAKITSVKIFFDGNPIQNISDAPGIISRAGFRGTPLDFEVLASPIDRGLVIGAGQEVLLFAGAKDRITDFAKIKSVLERVHVQIAYSSVDAHDYEAYLPAR